MADSHADDKSQPQTENKHCLRPSVETDSVSVTHIRSPANAYEKKLISPILHRSEDTNPFAGHEGSSDSLAHEHMSTGKLLGRPLGGFEVMYHHTMSKGMDMICLMTKLSTTFPIVPELAKQALYFLAQQHPLLRMTIVQDKTTDQISFLEMRKMKVDFSVANKDDWLALLTQEMAEPFDIQTGPLWKCRLLLSKTITEANENIGVCLNHAKGDEDDFSHEATFLFVWHHSIMDGGYVVWIFKEFTEILDIIHSGIKIDIDNKVVKSLPHPLDGTLEFPSDRRKPVSPKTSSCTKSISTVNLNAGVPLFDTLRDYNHRFAFEIAEGAEIPPRNACLVFEFNELETKRILQICKAKEVPANGLFCAASILAFIELVYPLSKRNNFKIPFEFMMDLRKHLPVKITDGVRKYFPGVASIHIPVMADVQLSCRPVTRQEFWEISRSFGSAIQNEIHSPETFHWIKTLIENPPLPSQEKAEKSPHVLCLSNMGRLDGILTGDIAKRIKLTGLHGHPTVLNEDSPILFVSIFSLNGKLQGNVSFCENYTSRKTAADYIGYLQRLILSQAKL